jgi:CubicO group peptidase (beta-lactamase class C family)
MRETIITFIFLACLTGYLHDDLDNIEQEIVKFENGLMAMSHPSMIAPFGAVKKTAVHKMKLQDRMTFYKVPAVSIALIDNYQIRWARAYGITRSDNKTSASVETYFEAGSTSKLLTALLALQLVEQGKILLNEDVNTYLRSWRIPDNEYTKENKVTLQLLLTHSAGISRPEDGFDYEDDSVPTLIQVLNGEQPALNNPALVEFVPGTNHQYSNLGFLVIQALLEDVTGTSYRSLVQESLFDPLEMRSSTFEFPLPKSVQINSAFPHDNTGAVHDHSLHVSAFAHGGLVTTPGDLAQLTIELMRAFKGESGTIVSQETVGEMLREQVELKPDQLFGLTQGLGVFLVGEGGDIYMIHMGYNNPGATCLVVASLESGKGIVIMTNGAGGLFLSLEIVASAIDKYYWPYRWLEEE